MPDHNLQVENATITLSESIDRDRLFALDEKLRQAVRPLTKEELRETRISLAMGMLPSDSTISRSDIEEVLDSGRA